MNITLRKFQSGENFPSILHIGAGSQRIEVRILGTQYDARSKVSNILLMKTNLFRTDRELPEPTVLPKEEAIAAIPMELDIVAPLFQQYQVDPAIQDLYAYDELYILPEGTRSNERRPVVVQQFGREDAPVTLKISLNHPKQPTDDPDLFIVNYPTSARIPVNKHWTMERIRRGERGMERIQEDLERWLDHIDDPAETSFILE